MKAKAKLPFTTQASSKNMRSIHLLFLFLTVSLGVSSKDYTVMSPDSLLAVHLTDTAGLHYSVSYRGRTVLKPSPLGIYRDDCRYGGVSETISSVSALRHGRISYQNDRGKCSLVDKAYNEQMFEVAQGRYAVIFRLYNHGVAFAYRLKGHGDTVRVYGEATGFTFPEGSRAFLTQMAKAKSGWQQTNPSYEDPYHVDVPLGEQSEHRQGWAFPALVHHNGLWTLISESGTTSDYVGCHLTEALENTLRIAFPEAAQDLYSDPSWAEMPTPSLTPWRLLVVSDTLSDIVETTLADDVVEPLYEAKHTMQPGKATWSWLFYGDELTSFEGTRQYIDLAASLGFRYCLVDAQWDQQIGRDRMSQLVAYGQQKGVGLLLWYNSNGCFNTAPQTPVNCMNTPKARRREMAWLKKIGIVGIKVDFFGGDKQSNMRLYADILRDANEAGLLVVFHGTTLPRGWQRMYPAFANAEAVMGQEFCRGEQDKENGRPRHAAILPFVRNAVAPMDFTPVVLSERLGPNRLCSRRATSVGFELALPVVFFEPMSHYGLTPDDLGAFPQEVWDYFRGLPTVWDETRFISGYPGCDIIIARRKGHTWYVAGINGEQKTKEMELDLTFCQRAKRVLLLTTAPGFLNKVSVHQWTPKNQRKVKVSLGPADGFVMKVE